MTLVLLVDDDPLIGEIVTDTLASAGYTVGLLSSGARVVEVVTIKQPALVILDCAMPEMPGIEVLRAIRASRHGFRLPVLMLTARASPLDREIAMRAGATAYMKKPFDPDELAGTVDQLINANEARSAARAAGRFR